jgi:predicted transposase/invertase (TIGR01784 family)
MKALRDWKTEIAGSFEEGKLEGIREGKLEAQIDTARRMKAEDFSLEMLTRISGLDPDILETL